MVPTGRAASVARMERSAIRVLPRGPIAPHSASLHAGYKLRGMRTRRTLLRFRCAKDDGLQRHATIGTEFAAQDLCHGVNDTIGVNTTAFSDLVD